MSDLTFFRHIFRELGIPWHRIGVCPVPDRSLVRYTDPCHCVFWLFRHKGGILCAGPYRNAPMGTPQLYALCAEWELPKETSSQLAAWFDTLTVIGEDDAVEAVLAACCDEIFGENGWELVTLDATENEDLPLSSSAYEREISPEDLARIEARYKSENEALLMVSNGDVDGIRNLTKSLGSSLSASVEKRTPDSLRNQKNYLVICNTLLRKAAEKGGVHPYYLDRVSSGFARQIEGARSLAACSQLLAAMLQRYVQLVRSFLDAGHSPLIQKVLVLIDSDLTRDLSLGALARTFFVTPQYLSSLFKKEMKQTLTDYVTGRRIRHALLLLGTTKMPVQQVAAYCGFSDAGYFARVFKSRIGLPPERYRKNLQGR